MLLGIDPKNDFAFKCVFGSEWHTGILVDVLNAVLRPGADRQVESVEVLNPIIESVVLDEKLSILDIKARDQSDRQFDIEMQMVPHPSFPQRFLYYWGKLHSGQLVVGERYDRLEPVISICFLDGVLFPEDERYALCFQLLERQSNRIFTDHLELHLFQLANFVKTADELRDPLDAWLYFLNNGKELDPDNLPAALQRPAIEEATEVLRMVTQDEIQRELYESREKARRDAASWQSALERWKEEVDQLKQEAERVGWELQRVSREAERAGQEAERANQEVERANRDAERANRDAERAKQEAASSRTQGELIGQIHAFQYILGQQQTAEEQLTAMSVDELRSLVDQLRSQLNGENQS